MNYQPFLDTNLLISDPLLLELRQLTPFFILTTVLFFYGFLAIHLAGYLLIRSARTARLKDLALRNEVITNA